MPPQRSASDLTHYVGPSSSVTFLHDVASWASSALTLTRQSRHSQHLAPFFNEPFGSQAASIVPDAYRPTSGQPGSLTPLTLPPAKEVFRLLDAFFADTGVILPYIHKRHVEDAYIAASRSQFRNTRTSLRCLLNMAFAFATYCHMSSPPTSREHFTESEIFFGRAQVLAASQEGQLTNIESGQGPII